MSHSEYASNTPTFVCCHVAKDRKPALEVFRDEQGDLQFFCGGEHPEGTPEGDPVVIAFAEMMAKDGTLRELVDQMHCGYEATRSKVGEPWAIVDPAEAAIHELVAKKWWWIGAVDDDEGSFAYSVGILPVLGAPEVIAAGLPTETLMTIINAYGEAVRKNAGALPLKKDIQGILEGHPVRLVPVTDAQIIRANCGYAAWFHGGDDFDLVQLVWPDKTGKFPGKGCDPDVIERQKLKP